MSDEANSTTQTATTETPAPANTAEARSPEGTILDQQQTQATETTSQTAGESNSKEKSLLNAEAKKEDAAPAKEGEAKKDDGKAPETYSEFKVPEGYQMDEKTLGEATKVFKDMNLSQENAQKLVDFYAAKSLEQAEQPYKQYEDMRNTWRDSIVKDKDLGNGVDNLRDDVKANIGRTIDSLGPELSRSFREAMDLTGVGDHPAFVKAMNTLAQRLTEGQHVSGKGPSQHGQVAPGSRPRSAAQAVFPNLPSSAQA